MLLEQWNKDVSLAHVPVPMIPTACQRPSGPLNKQKSFRWLFGYSMILVQDEMILGYITIISFDTHQARR